MNRTSNRAAVLVSGGIDSAVVLAKLLKEYRSVFPVYIRSGHVWEEAEMYWLKRFLKMLRSPRLKPCTYLSIPTLDLYPKHWSITGTSVPSGQSVSTAVYLPGRNIFLLTKAAACCALKKIPILALGSLATNPFSDARPSFLRQMEYALSCGFGFNLKILAPLITQTKASAIKTEGSLPFALTFSCISPIRQTKPRRTYLHCGRCNKCAEREKAFHSAGVSDPSVYYAAVR